MVHKNGSKYKSIFNCNMYANDLGWVVDDVIQLYRRPDIYYSIFYWMISQKVLDKLFRGKCISHRRIKPENINYYGYIQ